MTFRRVKNLFLVTREVAKVIKVKQFVVIYYLIKIKFAIPFWIGIFKKINKAKQVTDDKDNLGGWIDKDTAILLYSIVRILKPQTVVETGIGPGMSSAIILKALFDNNQGKLYSIDLPGYDKIFYPQVNKLANTHVPQGFKVGWLVDEIYFDYWEKLIGDSKNLLPKLVDRLLNIDLFMHDSLHTDEHIRFEFDIIKPKSHHNTVFLCDDVNEYWSTEFIKISKELGLSYYVYKERLGVGKQP